MKSRTIVCLLASAILNQNAFADIISDLTTAVQNNDVEALIAVIDSAALVSTPLSTMLADADAALAATTSSAYNNVAHQYLNDFRYRPYIDSVSSTVIYVCQGLFYTGNLGANAQVITTADRIIFKTIQGAMDYIANSPETSWTVVVNQAFYDENVTIPVNKNIVITGVGGVFIGNGGGDQFSSSVPRTVTWNIADNAAGNCSLKIQSTPYGCDTYRNFSYGRFLIGNFFTTNIISPITVPPVLEVDSVYSWSGMGTAVDIGHIKWTARNYRGGGTINFTSAELVEIDTFFVTQALICASLGSVTHVNFYDNWTITGSFSNTILDSNFGQATKTFTVPGGNLNLNYSTNYWWNNKTWGGSTIVPQDQ